MPENETNSPSIENQTNNHCSCNQASHSTIAQQSLKYLSKKNKLNKLHNFLPFIKLYVHIIDDNKM